jgi:uncharacterized protein (TIGR00369 family)
MDSEAFATWWRAHPHAPCEQMLGVQLIACDRDRSWVSLSFEVSEQFVNARGTVQGGFLAALLDTCLGIPVLLASDRNFAPVTLNLSVDYLSAVKAGRVLGEGQVDRMGRTTAFVSASLFDVDGKVLAKARQVAQLVEIPKG